MDTSADSKVRWNDVAGYESVKARLDDVVAHLLQRRELAQRGVPLSCGLVLEGLPGCGKTIMAHALAGPNGLYVSPSQLRGPSPDASVASLRAVFEQVRRAGPAVLVLDDLDLLVGSGLADECSRRLSLELRGQLEYAPVSGVFVIACVRVATSLPPGLRRAGRFDHHVSLMPPSAGDRRTIIEHHVEVLPGIELRSDIDLHKLAAATPLMTGADLAAIVRNAARRAMSVERDTIEIDEDHLLTALWHHRRSLTAVEVQRWLDEVRMLPGNEEAATALEQDLEAFRTGLGELATVDVRELLPSHSPLGHPIPRVNDDIVDGRVTLVSTAAPDPQWDQSPVARRERSTTQVLEQSPDPHWDPTATPGGTDPES